MALIWRQFANLVFNIGTQPGRIYMQDRKRSTKQGLARLIATLILAVVSALLGHNQLTKKKNYGPPPADVQGAARAIDGDSLFVGRHEVRLQGIDAPEGKQTCTRQNATWDCGNAARDELYFYYEK